MHIYKWFVNVCVLTGILISSSCNNETENYAVSPDGVKIRFDVQGTGEPAVVFVHGWSNNRTIWDAQVNYFSDKYKTVTVDLAGFGESGNNRREWTVASFAEDIKSVAGKHGLQRMVLVGFSMGAPVVIEAANRLPGQIAGIVIVDHLQDIEMRMPPEVMNSVEKLFMDLVSNPTNEKLLQGGFYKKNPGMSYKRVLAMLEGTSKTGWPEALRNTMKWQNDSCISSLVQLSVPVTSINSDRMPTNVAAFKNHIDSYQARIIPNTGHLVMWDAPDEFNRQLEASIIDFMQN